MADADLTHAILREIRDEIRATRTNLTDRLDAVHSELVVTRAELGQRIDLTNTRVGMVEHTLVEMSSQVTFISRYLNNSTKRYDSDIADLKARVSKLETR